MSARLTLRLRRDLPQADMAFEARGAWSMARAAAEWQARGFGLPASVDLWDEARGHWYRVHHPRGGFLRLTGRLDLAESAWQACLKEEDLARRHDALIEQVLDDVFDGCGPPPHKRPGLVLVWDDENPDA